LSERLMRSDVFAVMALPLLRRSRGQIPNQRGTANEYALADLLELQRTTLKELVHTGFADTQIGGRFAKIVAADRIDRRGWAWWNSISPVCFGSTRLGRLGHWAAPQKLDRLLFNTSPRWIQPAQRAKKA